MLLCGAPRAATWRGSRAMRFHRKRWSDRRRSASETPRSKHVSELTALLIRASRGSTRFFGVVQLGCATHWLAVRHPFRTVVGLELKRKQDTCTTLEDKSRWPLLLLVSPVRSERRRNWFRAACDNLWSLESLVKQIGEFASSRKVETVLCGEDLPRLFPGVVFEILLHDAWLIVTLVQRFVCVYLLLQKTGYENWSIQHEELQKHWGQAWDKPHQQQVQWHEHEHAQDAQHLSMHWERVVIVTLWCWVTCTIWLKFWVPSCHPCTCASLLEFTSLTL